MIIKIMMMMKIFVDVGLEWGINKCATIHIERGKLAPHDTPAELPVSNDCSNRSIPVIGNEYHWKVPEYSASRG